MWFVHKLAQALQRNPRRNAMNVYYDLVRTLRPTSQQFWGRATVNMHHTVHHPAIPVELHVQWFLDHRRKIGAYQWDLVQEYGEAIALRLQRLIAREPNGPNPWSNLKEVVRSRIRDWIYDGDAYGVYRFPWEVDAPSPDIDQDLLAFTSDPTGQILPPPPVATEIQPIQFNDPVLGTVSLRITADGGCVVREE